MVMAQVSNGPHTFESVPGPRGLKLVVVVVIETILGLGAWQAEQDVVSTVELVVVGLLIFIVTFAVYYYVRDRSDRVVISAEGVREFHRKRKSTGWVLRKETPCAEWAEARVNISFVDNGLLPMTMSLALVLENSKREKVIVLASTPDHGVAYLPGFERFAELESTADEINEILMRHRDGPPREPQDAQAGVQRYNHPYRKLPFSGLAVRDGSRDGRSTTLLRSSNAARRGGGVTSGF